MNARATASIARIESQVRSGALLTHRVVGSTIDTLDELRDEGVCCPHVVALARRAQQWFCQYIAVQAFLPDNPSKAGRAACIRRMAVAAFQELKAALELGVGHHAVAAPPARRASGAP